jgi:hypothetical protein
MGGRHQVMIGAHHCEVRGPVSPPDPSYAWTDPREVVRYVKRNAARLSPLSKREALKNCAR